MRSRQLDIRPRVGAPPGLALASDEFINLDVQKIEPLRFGDLGDMADVLQPLEDVEMSENPSIEEGSL